MRTLYALSKPVMDNPPYLIGELSEENGEYKFKYRLGDKLPKWYLRIDEFPNIQKEYSGQAVLDFIKRILPEPDKPWTKDFVLAAGLEKYDIWGMLKYYGQYNFDEDAFLYEQLPEKVVING